MATLIRALFLAAVLVVATLSAALAAYTPPAMQDAVTDTTGKLSSSDDRALEERLTAYRNRTGNEIAVLVVASLAGETIDEVAHRTFNTWHIGKKGVDNGVLLVIAPNERRTRIETGKGVGDKLTDADCSAILRERVDPLLKQDRFREAIEAALDSIETKLDGASGRTGQILFGCLFAALLLFIVGLPLWVEIRRRKQRRGRGRHDGNWAGIERDHGSTSHSSSDSSSVDTSYSGGGGSSAGGGASDHY